VLLHTVFMINIQTLLSPRASVGYVIHSSFACVRNSCTLCLGSDPEFNRRALLSLSEGLQDKINLIVHHIIKTLTTVERSVELTLTRFAILRGYLAMNAKYGYVDGCVEVGPGHALRHTAPTACAPFFLCAYGCLSSLGSRASLNILGCWRGMQLY
jgi:hypothetical protein